MPAGFLLVFQDVAKGLLGPKVGKGTAKGSSFKAHRLCNFAKPAEDAVEC